MLPSLSWVDQWVLLDYSLMAMKQICVPKFSPSRTWEKNFSGWQEVQSVTFWFMSAMVSSWILWGRMPPRSRRILWIKHNNHLCKGLICFHEKNFLEFLLPYVDRDGGEGVNQGRSNISRVTLALTIGAWPLSST